MICAPLRDNPVVLIGPRCQMGSFSTNEFKSGLKIILENDPYSIVENEMVKPGKGQAFNRVKVRNLKTGRVIERTFKSGDSVEAADVVETDMQYLYTDGEFWHFMVPDTFEQYTAGKEAMGEGAIVAEGRHEVHRHAVERRAAERHAAGARRAQDRRDRSGRARRHRDRRRQAGEARDRRRRCACRCSSTKAKSSASIRGPGSTCRAARADDAHVGARSPTSDAFEQAPRPLAPGRA